MNKVGQIIKQISFDFFAASLSWGLFYIFRKLYLEPLKYGYQAPLELNNNFYLGITIIPVCWILLYSVAGTYRDPFRKSRLKELGQTISLTLIGTIFIFFVLILDDEIVGYKAYYTSFITLFGLHLTFTYVPRLINSTGIAHKIHNRELGFKTLMIGGNGKATKLYHDLEDLERSMGNILVGFLNVYDREEYQLEKHLPHLGSYKEARGLIEEHEIEEVIIAIESSEHAAIKRIISLVDNHNVLIKIIPDMYDILTGSVKMNTIYGTPLIEISSTIMPVWQRNVKRIIDLVVSMFVLIFCIPIFIIIAIIIKIDSTGPVFYSHERIGKNGRPFNIYKFRSMEVNAEVGGPALSCDDDNRITRFGNFMRKTRVDEMPQFFNVIIGNMSLVGPRPEREFFINQIVQTAPHYRHLHKVLPGITSWGQVKYGYAENVDEMIERLRYDIIYIENMSLAVDFKIMIYTVLTILRAGGK